MKYGYTIVYVGDVETTLNFYRNAFGFGIKFIHESPVKPWGQTVGYVRGIDGSIIELCTAIDS